MSIKTLFNIIALILALTMTSACGYEDEPLGRTIPYKADVSGVDRYKNTDKYTSTGIVSSEGGIVTVAPADGAPKLYRASVQCGPEKASLYWDPKTAEELPPTPQETSWGVVSFVGTKESWDLVLDIKPNRSGDNRIITIEIRALNSYRKITLTQAAG